MGLVLKKWRGGNAPTLLPRELRGVKTMTSIAQKRIFVSKSGFKGRYWQMVKYAHNEAKLGQNPERILQNAIKKSF